jgi:hypothetical protein
MKTLLAFATAVAALGLSAANATTFIFKGDGGLNDSPAANAATNCGTLGFDFCTIDHTLGFTYAKDGISVTAKAYANGNPTLLIQDITPDNSGLGAFSENDVDNDQTQFSSGEAIDFLFNQQVRLSDIEFNAGNDTDCSTFGIEGPCGSFDLFIDNVFFMNIEAIDLLTMEFIGTLFRFVPTTPNAGFAIARFEVEPVPVPAALPLFITGVAGFAFASRRRKRP